MDIILKEQQRHIRLEHPDKSAIAEHSIDQGHCNVREAIVIELHPYIINREGGFHLSKSWKPLTGSLKLSGHVVTWFCIPSIFTNTNPTL
jgi:hypothetical protein